MDELCGVGAELRGVGIAAELLLVAAELDIGLGLGGAGAGADVCICICVLGDVAAFVVALWLLGCASVDVIAVEPAGVALSRLAAERLLKAREPKTAIPAKPLVVVILRASERRRWDGRLRRWPVASAAGPPFGTNSNSAGMVPPWSVGRAGACACAWSLTRLRPGLAPTEAVAPVLAPWFAGIGIARSSGRPAAGLRIWTPGGGACA